MNRTDAMFRDRFSGSSLPLLLWGVTALVTIVWFVVDTSARFGALPGDVLIDAGDTRIYLPFSTTLLVSILVTGFFYAIGSFFSRR